MKCCGEMIVAVTLVLSSMARADDAAGLSAFDAGTAARHNEAVARGHFLTAAKEFARAIELGGETPARLRMLGLASLHAGELPQAIRAFRRGLQLSPDDNAMREGLEFARGRVTYQHPDEHLALVPPPPEFAAPARLMRRYGILAIALSGAVGWLAVGRWLVTRRRAWLMLAIALLAATATLAIGWMGERFVRDKYNARPIGVVRESHVLRRGDGPSYLPRRDSPLPPGVELSVLQQRNGWVHVELADGSLGWLRRGALLMESD